ncbi:MAG: hypothetical protein EON58_22945 [Alphaproteobacteria bacterium]|nr:MAG: hypothetical protein EON58_22945 [Alphaproteobacteria bacterium]
MNAYRLFKAQVSSTPVADALHEVGSREASRSSRWLRYGTVTKLGRYVAAFLICALGVFAIGTVLSGHFRTFWECFFVESLGLTLFYYGQKLAWLTYDPEIMTRGDQAREARIAKRVAAIQRTRAEREQAEGIRH